MYFRSLPHVSMKLPECIAPYVPVLVYIIIYCICIGTSVARPASRLPLRITSPASLSSSHPRPAQPLVECVPKFGLLLGS
jgi:hypothetical protein